MLLPSKTHRGKPSGLRAALGAARETYRQHSAADAGEPEAPSAAQPPAERRLPALAARGRQAARRLREQRPAPARDEPDVLLDVGHLHVDEIELKLDELKARVALEARVMDLLRLDVGVDAELRGVGLTIKGVDAQALLKVRLENLTVILDRVMNTVDRNPQLLARLAEHLGATLEEVGSGAGKAVGDIGGGVGSAVDEVGGLARDLAPGAPRQNGGAARDAGSDAP